MSSKTSKNIVLAVVLILIIAFIVYLEAKKPPVPTTPVQTLSSASTTPTAAEMNLTPAKELADIQGYINSPAILNGTASTTAPFTIAQLLAQHKVVLIDFWTYSCINCLRTIPYLNAWYQKYKDQGLVIIGVHTPEFDFEKDYSNVTAAVQRLGIQYPVVLDSNMGTWYAYDNQYWPHEFLINTDGYIVDDHIGEGGYDQTEAAIQNALKQRDQEFGITETVSSTTTSPTNVIAMDPEEVDSPETYFGSARNEYLGNGTVGVPGAQTLLVPASILSNTLYLGGVWNFTDQYAENTSPTATITYQYDSKNMYIVAAADASAPASGVKVKVILDGKPIPASQMGADVAPDGTMTITGNRLYSIVNGDGYGQHTLQLQVQGSGLDAYTFTFG